MSPDGVLLQDEAVMRTDVLSPDSALQLVVAGARTRIFRCRRRLGRTGYVMLRNDPRVTHVNPARTAMR